MTFSIKFLSVTLEFHSDVAQWGTFFSPVFLHLLSLFSCSLASFFFLSSYVPALSWISNKK